MKITLQFVKKSGLAGILFSLSFLPAEAVILFGAGNDANLTDPGTGLPFDAVGRVQSSLGAQNGGSGVHLGGGYMLTAAHISQTETNTVTFDGTTTYQRDLNFSPVQIGNTDMRLFRLTSVPTVGAVNIYSGSDEFQNSGYLVGWGRGREEGSDLSTNTVPIAGSGTPLVRRWGTNDPTRTINDFNYTRSSTTYNFDAIETVLGNQSGNPSTHGTGDFEAAATVRDSGAGYFQEIDGVWYLTGLAVVIFQQDPGNVTYGNDVAWSGSTVGVDYGRPQGAGDANVYVRISSYADEIAMIIPEPSSAMMFTVTLAGLLMRRSRRPTASI